jgi:DNA-binding NarL/FixJ family response regulator
MRAPSTPSFETQEQPLPVVAIGSDGDITGVNDPARRILHVEQRETGDESLGALIASLLAQDPRSEASASLSLTDSQEEDAPVQALTIVLSARPAAAKAAQSTEARATRAEHRHARHAADHCAACRLRSPLEAIQRVARTLRTRDGLDRSGDASSALAMLEAEAERASLLVEDLIGREQADGHERPEPSAVPTRAAPREIAEVVQSSPLSKYGLTHREIDVLQQLAEGQTDRRIAESLGISTYTVNKHVANILGKMAASSRTAAGVRAIREGILG